MELLFDGDPAAPAFVFAHGAGAAMDSRGMTALATRIAERGVRVVRFEFAYMAARRQGRRKPPPRADTLLGEYRAVLDAVGGRPAIGGRSMGGRVASMIAADPDVAAARLMQKSVHRDAHKMTAFVRFRPPDEPEGVHVAWFEPEHHIVAATAPFFARRFAQMRWAILTPRRSVRWDGAALSFGPGARRDDAPPDDAAVALWLTYYESIFNPARLKLSMMRKEMPRRYWKNLPEAALIGPLSARAAQRSAQMIAQEPVEPVRRRPAASAALRRDALGAGVASVGASPATLAALAQGMERCRDCPIGAGATQAVPGEGPAYAQLMFVGEQPGDQEDLAGQPFVGPAGQMLDKALAE